MPDLPELFKDAIGDVPAFEPAALAARARRHRRHQVGAGAASAVLIVALVVAVFGVDRSDSGDHVALHTRAGSSTVASSTTAAPLPTLANTTTTNRSRGTSATATSTSAPPATLSAAAASANPSAADFTGTLTIDRATARVGERVAVDWSIRNVTDHPVFPFYLGIYANDLHPDITQNVAAFCAPLTADGQPAIRLTMATNRNFFEPAPYGYLQPGGSLESSSHYTPNANDVGTVTCEVVILDLTNGYTDMRVLARVAAIPPVTITVLPDDTTTSTSTTSTGSPPPTT